MLADWVCEPLGTIGGMVVGVGGMDVDVGRMGLFHDP
jgi:hypothetical protein